MNKYNVGDMVWDVNLGISISEVKITSVRWNGEEYRYTFTDGTGNYNDFDGRCLFPTLEAAKQHITDSITIYRYGEQ